MNAGELLESRDELLENRITAFAKRRVNAIVRSGVEWLPLVDMAAAAYILGLRDAADAQAAADRKLEEPQQR